MTSIMHWTRCSRASPDWHQQCLIDPLRLKSYRIQSRSPRLLALKFLQESQISMSLLSGTLIVPLRKSNHKVDLHHNSCKLRTHSMKQGPSTLPFQSKNRLSQVWDQLQLRETCSCVKWQILCSSSKRITVRTDLNLILFQKSSLISSITTESSNSGQHSHREVTLSMTGGCTTSSSAWTK